MSVTEEIVVTAFHPLVPSKAIEMLEAAGIPHAQQLIRDHAASGLVKSYAKLIETIQVTGESTSVRGGTITKDLWRRMVREGAEAHVLTGGTVRLAAADLIGGAPAVEITGIGFNETDLQRLVDQHRGAPVKPKRAAKALAPAPIVATMPAVEEQEPEPVSNRRRSAPDLSVLHSGALLLTVNETKAALGIGHTTVYKLVNAGTLERREIAGGVRITSASVKAFAGIAV